MLQPSCEAAVKSRFRSPTLPFAEIYATDDLVQPQQEHHKYTQTQSLENPTCKVSQNGTPQA